MNTFFKILAALVTAISVVLLTMKIIDVVRSSDREKKRLYEFKSKLQLPKLKKNNDLKKAADMLRDEIDDFRDGADDDLFLDAADRVSEIADEAADDFTQAVDDLTEDAADFIDEAADNAKAFFDSDEEYSGDISEDVLDSLLDN